MSFDSHSLDRLRELGRQLPQRLPDPDPQEVVKPGQRRHKVETEDDPEALFRELMKVSEDGSVPEHLMERLKQLEAKRRPTPQPLVNDSLSSFDPPNASAGVGRKGKNTLPQRPKVSPGSEEESLYVAFGQLLLEDDEDQD